MKDVKKVFLLLVMVSMAASMADAAVLGTDSFDYPDGSIAGQSGGTGWDAGGLSDWNVDWGAPVISGGALKTQDSGVIREFGADEHAGAIQATGQIYFGATMTVTADNYSWAGISSYDFGSERIFFGCPGAQSVLGPNGLGYYGIDIPGDPANALTNIPIAKNQPARILGCIDFDGQQMLLWVNPDADDYHNGGGDNSADAVLAWTSTNWCSAVRLASFNATEWDDLIVAGTLEEALYLNMAHYPLPAFGQENVLVGGLELSWAVPQVPSQGDPDVFVADPNLASFELRYSVNDPNLNAVSPISITTWDAGTLRASYTPAQLSKDSTCIWRVDSVMDDATVIQGIEWVFYTQLSKAIILSGPGYQIVDPGAAAVFSVAVSTESPASYQWYKYVDGISDIMLTDGGNIFGAMTDTLSITPAAVEDEGRYYCIVNNQSQIEVISKMAPLGIKRKIAYWPFEGGVMDSTVAGSPVSVVVGDPNVAAGVVGDAMAFDDGVDMLYTDPVQTSYFDICDYEMTVACWVKTTDSQDWCALVARNGEGEGWQLRQSGFTDDRPCFTTRGTGSEDGTPAARNIYDGQWHYVVATLDGSVKKIYIDGILSRRYSADDGSVVLEGDPVNTPVRNSLSPVAIAGRVSRHINHAEGLNIETGNIVAGTYDEVAIYNYALDAAAIAQAYADVTGTDVCLGQALDLDNDCSVNLNDLGLLASEWLNDGNIEPAL